MREADSVADATALVADLAVQGVWLPQAEALFDVRVIDNGASLTAVTHLEKCYSLQRERRKTNMELLVRRGGHSSLLFVVRWMVCLERRLKVF